MANIAAKLKILAEIPVAFRAKCVYTLRCLSQIWGIGIELFYNCDQAHEAHVIYSERVKFLRFEQQIFIPFDASLYQDSTVCNAGDCKNRKIWCKQGALPETTDLIATTFRLLTMKDELQVPASKRDKNGSFTTGDLPVTRQESLGIPLVENHAELIFEHIVENHPFFKDRLVPRWPENKTFAVCVTHDTDAVHIGNRLELATSLAKWVLRRDKLYLDEFLEGLKYHNKPMQNPYWGFPGWYEFEKDTNIRSCFFIATPPNATERVLNDCKSYMFGKGFDWNLLKKMSHEGWEFGLHPPLCARNDTNVFICGKQMIEERLGHPILGLRHHYLAYDNLTPEETFKKHIAAGFKYDSSVGWRDRPGFRAGTCLPWYPYDKATGGAMELLEIPLVLMDVHVMDGGVEKAVKACRQCVESVRSKGGVLTLNWHTETFCNRFEFKSFLDVFRAIVILLTDAPDVWFATPKQIAEWWTARGDRLFVQ